MVFFSKLMGDFYRYICENVEGQELEEITDLANHAYQMSQD